MEWEWLTATTQCTAPAPVQNRKYRTITIIQTAKTHDLTGQVLWKFKCVRRWWTLSFSLELVANSHLSHCTRAVSCTFYNIIGNGNGQSAQTQFGYYIISCTTNYHIILNQELIFSCGSNMKLTESNHTKNESGTEKI